jgi:rhodanese-related sulfurtransferase
VHDEPELSEGPEQRTRFRRKRRRSRWLMVLLIIVLPILVGAATALFVGRTIAFRAVQWRTARRFPDVHWIDPAGLARWRADSTKAQPVLLDARTADEYAVSRLPGAARMDPYRPSLRPLRGMPKDTAIVVYSSVGYRSARLARWLATQGYINVTNLSGSIFQWADEGRPLERDGRPVTQVHPYDDSWGYLLESEYRIEAPPVEKRSAAP